MIKKALFLLVLMAAFFFGAGIHTSLAAENKLILINKTNNQLAYYNSGKLVKTFAVGTGRKPSYTPEGRFKIVNKIINRPYYTGHIPGGDPRNPLGNRWLGLNARGTWGTTYAIHGNNNPASIGGYVSGGCIRMYDNEVEWLYSQVSVGTPVIIAATSKSFNSLAASYGYKVSGTAPSSPSVPASLLKKGSKSSAVTALQKKLTSLGYNTYGTDGIFGSKTESALKKYQKANGLKADGIAGPLTLKKLGL
ncbi:L,D-transpeptidase family protein [Peribacillus kribbensis]|uniref:L,D-transpeptidase family protein n=1 Tax=Peribacillus kribbensis TaxID=356658 RepID=UPI0004034961|nr:L,D-transpeptidase family protein [Peribacillus kribbensis]